MGLFDIFKSKKSADAEPAAEPVEPAPPAGWAARLNDYWHWEDEQKWAVAPKLVADVGAVFESARTKVKREDDEIELRARLGELPLRVKFEVDMGWVSLELKADNRVGIVHLEYDPEKGPIDRDEDEDWGDDDEGVRVFVAKGVFLEDDWPTVEESIGVLGSMPEEFVGELYAGIQRLKLQNFILTLDRVMVGFTPNFYEMADPLAEIRAAAELAARAAGVIAAGSRDLTAQPSIFVGGAVAVAHPERVTCSYCQTQFPLGASAQCPNCGAPYTG